MGLLHALHSLQGNIVSKQQLATEGIHIEQDILKETVGSQDQVMAAHGGFNHVTFHPNGEISVRPMTLPRERIASLQAHLMLFYTGIRRTASDVAKSYVIDMDSKKRQLRIMRDLVEESVSFLNGRHDIIGFGHLIHEAWQAKRSLGANVTNSEVDAIYDAARHAGAIGGKLTGAGGGGFMLLFVPPAQQKKVRDKLNKLVLVPFQFDTGGSQIIFYDPGEDYAAAEKDRDSRSIQAFRELVVQ